MIGILAQATATPCALSSGGTTIDYVVARRRMQATKSAAPQKF